MLQSLSEYPAHRGSSHRAWLHAQRADGRADMPRAALSLVDRLRH